MKVSLFVFEAFFDGALRVVNLLVGGFIADNYGGVAGVS
jgi:hypothetical protein